MRHREIVNAWLAFHHTMTYRIFVDESIHDSDGFIATAFIFGDATLEIGIERALRACGLTPGEHEFKSSALMRDNLLLRELRGALKTVIVNSGAPVALLISAASRRVQLGEEIVDTIGRMAESNGVDLSSAEVFVDQGIRRPRSLPLVPYFAFGQDSRTVLGLQAADLTASLGAYILREALHGVRKQVRRDGDDVEVDLGWVFKMQLRRNFWRKHAQFTGENYDEWFAAELLGYGVLLGRDVPASVGEALENSLGGVWLGCTR